MANRLDLQEKLEELIGKSRVFFQPPESIKLKYPCLLYNLENIDQRFADDKTYLGKKRYSLTYITKNPDDNKVEEILNTFSLLRFDRCYTADNLNHYVYTICW